MNRQRRAVVKGLAAVSLTTLSGCGGKGDESVSLEQESARASSKSLPGVEFRHGVASGDPLWDRVVLWTRVSPVGVFERNAGEIPVSVVIATDPGLSQVVGRQMVKTGIDSDFCVKVDAQGLQANRWYYYQFSVGGQVSPMGRTRTFPTSKQAVERARFAVVSCSNYAYGLFSVYRAISAQTDLDFVLHLGDYIYEYGPGEYGDFPGREPNPPHEITELDHYRRRHAQYKTDPHLQATHQQFPMICIWDDHESANDSHVNGAENHDEATEGAWSERKSDAIQAYFEWLPIRSFEADPDRIWRAFSFGGLIDLFMLDTRLEGRDQPVASMTDPARFDAGRRLVSEAQMQWLQSGLEASSASWRFIGQQVMLAELNVARTLDAAETLGIGDVNGFNGQLLSLNMDQWDGYVSDRENILTTLRDKGIDNTVIFTGDIHTSWANEIQYDPGNPGEAPLAAEFVTPSVTSPGFPEDLAEPAAVAVRVANPHMKYVELKSPGFMLVDVTRERTQSEFYYVRNITGEDDVGQLDSSKTKVVGVRAGDARIFEDAPVSRPRTMRTALFHPPVSARIA
jgi:alkaline phosphatase D